MSIRYLWIIVLFGGFVSTVQATWQAAAWNVLQEAVTNLSIDTVQSFFKPEELANLKKKIAELNAQLEQYKQIPQLSQAEINKVQQTLASVDHAVSTLNGNLSAVEQ